MGEAGKAIAAVEEKMAYSEKEAEFSKKAIENHEKFLKMMEEVRQRRGNALAAAVLRSAIGLDDKPAGG